MLAWLNAADESIVEVMRVPKLLYFEIDSDVTVWQPLQERVSEGLFVDAQRMMIEGR